jgi:CRP/FNR family transcriptional regulator, polysaccharide utilization system transcription regulator
MKDRILIIEDQAEFRDSLSELLGLAGYEVFPAPDGRSGLEMARHDLPDLVLCDIMMDGLDGYGVLRAMGNIPELANTPFVFMTAKAEKTDFRKGMDLGADDYLTKPFDEEELLSLVSARLKKRKTKQKFGEEVIRELSENSELIFPVEELSVFSSNLMERQLKDREVLYAEGDAAPFVYYLASGKVRCNISNQWAKELVSEIHGPGEFIGVSGVLVGDFHHDSALAMERTRVYLIPKTEFYMALYDYPELSVRLSRSLAARLRSSELRQSSLAYESARKRVANALNHLIDRYSTPGLQALEFPFHRELLAAISGISMESVSRNLSTFKTEGLIDITDGNLHILDRNRLSSVNG